MRTSSVCARGCEHHPKSAKLPTELPTIFPAIFEGGIRGMVLMELSDFVRWRAQTGGTAHSGWLPQVGGPTVSSEVVVPRELNAGT